MWQFLKVHLHCGVYFWTNENCWYFIKVTSLDLLLTSEKAPNRFGLSVVSSPSKPSWISPITRMFRNTAFLHWKVSSLIFPERETPLQIELGSILDVKHSPKRNGVTTWTWSTWLWHDQGLSNDFGEPSPQLRQVLSTWKLLTISIISTTVSFRRCFLGVGWLVVCSFTKRSGTMRTLPGTQLKAKMFRSYLLLPWISFLNGQKWRWKQSRS